MITHKLKIRVLKAYKTCLSDFQYREWHANERAAHEEIRQIAVGKPNRLNDGMLAALLYDWHELPGDYGQTWSHGKPATLHAPFRVAKRAFRKLLRKVQKAETITEREFNNYSTTLTSVGIPAAVIHRFAAACFPTQLSAVVVEKQLDSAYQKLAADNAIAPTAKTWFEKNTITIRWIKEALPGTDDEWRSVLVWYLH